MYSQDDGWGSSSSFVLVPINAAPCSSQASQLAKVYSIAKRRMNEEKQQINCLKIKNSYFSHFPHTYETIFRWEIRAGVDDECIIFILFSIFL